MSDWLIGHYRITRKLGAGGMGIVYLAQDTMLDRQVAIKVLPDDLTAESNLGRRFIAEAKAASALNHPNVRMIYDVRNADDGRPFIVMEYVEGDTLDARIREGPLDIESIIEYGIQIADALDAAHEKRIVHRDIKPSNIALTARNQVKVLDFGLAKRVSSESGLEATVTQSGQILGTPSYMSPEQALGRPVDFRSDFFSLGVVLYQMATGRMPFRGSGFGDTVDRIVHAQPEAMARFNYDIPPELERITLKCLQKDKDRRYQSARELLVDLKNLKQRPDLSTKLGGELNTSPKDDTLHSQSPTQSGSRTSVLVQAGELKNSDIFICCAQIDDEPLPPEREGWISQFERNLRIRLEQLLGESVRVLSCPMPSGDVLPDETVMDVVPSAKTLISVVSPPFTKSAGCRHSVVAFCGREGDSEHAATEWRLRLFKVLKTPVIEHELSPDLAGLFSQVLGFEFFEADPQTGRVREFHERFGPEARQHYYERIYDLAQEISGVLRKLRGAAGDVHAAAQAATGKTVYLATTTSDIAAEREVLRRELIARGHRVMPDRPLALEAGQLTAQVWDFLAACQFCVHPIGGRYGMIVEGAEESVPEIQNRLAAQAGLNRLIWIPRALDVTDARQAKWIEALRRDPHQHRGGELIEDRIEVFKTTLIDRLKPPPAAPRAEAGTGPPRVYVIYDRKDEEAIDVVEDFLFERGIETILPAFDVSEAEVQDTHIQNLRDCDAAIIYYGAVGRHWVDFHIRDLAKAAGYRDSKPIPVQAVYLAPPFDRRKERFKSLSVQIFRQESDSATGLLTPLANQIKALRARS
jgi:serine/threonine protein kinase